MLKKTRINYIQYKQKKTQDSLGQSHREDEETGQTKSPQGHTEETTGSQRSGNRSPRNLKRP